MKYFFHNVLYSFVTIVSLLCCNSLLAQRAKIDSLKKDLFFLHDSAQVDCLNTLSLVYTYLQVDSAKLYSQRAYAEATKINYVRGIIISLNNEAHIAGLALHDFPMQEKISLQTIESYKELNNEKILSDTYMNLALAFFCQSNFSGSANVCNKIIQLSSQSEDTKHLGEAIAIMGSISFESGNYEKSFDYFNQSLQTFTSIHDSYNTAIILAKLGDLYRMSGDSKMALKFYFQSLKYPVTTSLIWYPLTDLGDTYYSLEQYDSVTSDEDKYMQTIKSLTVRSNYITFPKILLAENYMASQQYDTALAILNVELMVSKRNNDKNKLMRSLFDIGKAYEGKKNYKKAFYYTKDLLQNAQQYQLKQYVRDAYKLMYTLFDHLHNVDSAYVYYRQYTYMKDFVALDDFTKKLAIYKAVTETEKNQQQIELLSKEKIINQQQLQLSKQQLKNESLAKKVLIGSVISLLLFGFILFRNVTLKRKNETSRHVVIEKELRVQQLESERTKTELQQQAVELEMQALRAQMNPHFIFNCLNSINRFIIANNAIQAANHLTKFAKLIRIVLEQSGKSFISLDDELYCLQLYMDLEALRFEIPFQYKINTNEINTSNVMIPSLLLQPFVENAIWHGLHSGKVKNGKINIIMHLQNNILHCKINDNGIGRAKAAALGKENESNKESFGIKLTQQRLQLIDPLKQHETGIEIYDLKDESGENAGTCVEIKIPVKEI